MKLPRRPLKAVILAAGRGTRMKSELPKVLHPLLGKPIVSYITGACRKAGVDEVCLVIGHKAGLVKETLGPEHTYAEQVQQLGTGHALMTAAETMKGFRGDVMVLAGDTPFLTGQILKKLIKKHRETNAAATLMTARLDPTPPYGRILRNNDGHIQRIVEDRDATTEQKQITEVNTSHYCFNAGIVFSLLKSLKNDNDQSEYYLTDIIQMLVEKGERVESMTAKDPDILIGINSRKELSASGLKLKEKIIDHWMAKGVSVVDPGSVIIEPDVTIGPDTVIHPFTLLAGKTTVGAGCEIGPQTHLKNARIGKECRITFSVIENRKIEDGAVIGPFASIAGSP